MNYILYRQGNDLYVNITRGGFRGYIMVERLDGSMRGSYIKNIYINRPRGGKGGAIVRDMDKIRYKVIFPDNHKVFDNRQIKPSIVQGYSLLSPIKGVPRLTSPYGWRTIFGKKNFHRGQDYAKPPERGVPLRYGRSLVGGTLYRYYEEFGFGRYVYIKCDDGFGIVYAHLDAYGVPSGSRVDKNTIIGYSGGSGHVTAPHVHIELHKRFGGGFTSSNAVPFTLNPR